MGKIEELIFKHDLEFVEKRQDIIDAMKEYAEFYVGECVKHIDENFEWDHDMEKWTAPAKPSYYDDFPNHVDL